MVVEAMKLYSWADVFIVVALGTSSWDGWIILLDKVCDSVLGQGSIIY